MKKLIYLLLIPFVLLNSSCTMMIKSMGKSIAKRYDDHTDLNISTLEIKDGKGNNTTFGHAYAGKTVYLYVWKHKLLLPPGDQEPAYAELKARFARYKDVVFVDIYTGNTEEDWQQVLALKNTGVAAYRLGTAEANTEFQTLTAGMTAPMIIGKDGHILGFEGPKPTDKLLVDYALFQAREGKDATQSAKEMIKGINSKMYFKDKKLAAWYELHYGKKPGKLNAAISSPSSRIEN